MNSRLDLIFMIDALGFEEAKDPGFLPEADRPRAPVRSVLGYSSSCIPSIMSGLTPDQHGHFSMYRRSQNGGVFDLPGKIVPLLARVTGRHWTLRKWIARYLRGRGITGYFALYEIPLVWLHHFDLCQRRNLYRPGAFDGHPGLADLLEKAGGHRIWDWSQSEEQSFSELELEVERGEKRTLFFYTAELDSLMHTVGPEAKATREKLSEYSERIGKVLADARRRYREVRVYVFGDHGMAPVQGSHDLWGEIRKLPYQVPRDLLYFLDSTMARFWFHDAGARREVEGLLSGLDYGRILSAEELVTLGTNFSRGEYGELIFLLHEGELIVPSFMGLSPLKGMHGYHPEDRCSFTTLVTNDPEVDYPENLLDLHQCQKGVVLGSAS